MESISPNLRNALVTEAVLFDSLWAFHEQLFRESLNNLELKSLLVAYPQDTPDDFDYRKYLHDLSPQAQQAIRPGRVALAKVLRCMGADALPPGLEALDGQESDGVA